MAGDPPYIPPAPPRGPAGNFVISSIGLIARALRNPNYAVYVAGNSVSANWLTPRAAARNPAASFAVQDD